MDQEIRRQKILEIISERQDKPISAAELAQLFDVSRQVVVGDVALLRAAGSEIVATARGYIFMKPVAENKYVRKIVCCHNRQETKAELYAIVELGATVEDVIIEHDQYGEIVGQLNIKTTEDIEIFMEKLEQSNPKLLSELTGGIHLHTIVCQSLEHYQKVIKVLEDKGFLYKGSVWPFAFSN